MFISILSWIEDQKKPKTQNKKKKIQNQEVFGLDVIIVEQFYI